MKAYYTLIADRIFQICGANSIEEARCFVPEVDWHTIVETDEEVFMNIETGSVDFQSNWESEGIDPDDLAWVVYNSARECWEER